MQTFIIYEQEKANGYREGYRYTCASLTSAKRLAKRKQFFTRTWLKIEDEQGNLLALCDNNGSWKNGTTYIKN